MLDPWDVIKLLADPTRLRLIHLLTKEELSVAELQEILDMGQSRISSHLALLRQGDLVLDRKEGKKHYYTLSETLQPELKSLVDCACKAIADKAEVREDLENLHATIDKRQRASEKYFNTIAGRLGKNYCPGRSWEAIGSFLLHLTPHIKIADLGAGEGMLAQLLARQAEIVYCIDNSPRMVEVGTELAQKQGISNLHYKLGNIEKIPLQKNSVDLAYLSQALHHASHPQTAISEAYRILKPNGKLIIIDLKEHNFEKARELYADMWLGFKENVISRYMQEAGFHQVEVNIVAREEQEPFFETLLASGVKR